MGVMHVSTDDVIEVIAVGNAFMPAFWAMSVVASVRFTLVIWRAVVGIGSTDGDSVLVDVAVMEVVHMTIMKIVRMSLVGYSHVPATGTMLVTVFGVLGALTFFHCCSFRPEYPIRSCASGKESAYPCFFRVDGVDIPGGIQGTDGAVQNVSPFRLTDLR
jgi:hypothetical protein